MPLHPDDVIRKTFRTTQLRRGYDESQVDAFLEEVVTELRRQQARVEELEGEVAGHTSRGADDEVSERVQREQHQVDLIRAERRELVTELAEVQARLDRSTTAADEADERAAAAEGAARQAQSRQEEAEAGLAAKEDALRRVQAELDQTVAAHDRAATELRTLRVAAETRGTETFGDDLDLPEGDDPQRTDLDVILTVARRLHEDYVEQGRAEGDRLREQARVESEAVLARAQADAEAQTAQAREQSVGLLDQAQAEHDRLVGEAQAEQERLLGQGRSEHERLVGEGQGERERLLADARAEHDRLLAEAQGEHHRLLTEGRDQHDRLVAEAEEERAGILADLQTRRTMLEQRLAGLDEAQAGYRQRLRELVQAQLSALDDEAWRR